MPKGRTYKVLGTDGFGRSDSRVKLREFFEVNRYYITVAALKSLADEGKIDASVVAQAHREVRHRSEQAKSGDPVNATHVVPAKAGTHAARMPRAWVPACAGTTRLNK